MKPGSFGEERAGSGVVMAGVEGTAGKTSGVLAQAREVLRTYWGYPSFRTGQEEVVAAVLSGRDVLGVLPTGGGKSICYQVPALVREGMTLVVSPLISLMQDQVASLQARGIPAAFINSTLSAREIEQRWNDAEFGRYRLLYVAPERLHSDLLVARAERFQVALLAVDEAHCISEWGAHFRPAYQQIAEAHARLGSPPVVALTATATPQVRRDIIEHLHLRDPVVIVRGFDRPNIIWSIFRTENKREKVRDVVRNVPGSGILYAATRRAVEHWARWLEEQGVTAAAYHGGLEPETRRTVQDGWLRGDIRVVVATNAFGMGIDKADVRFVVHVDVPASLEGYYQEAGRAGRDGRRAYAVLLYHPADAETQRALIEEAHPSAAEVRAVYDAACNLARIPVAVQPEAPVALDFDALARLCGLGKAKVRQAVELLARQGTWVPLPPRRHHGLIRFLQPAEALRTYATGRANRALATFVEHLLRSVHADAFTTWWEIDVRRLARRTGLPRERLLRGLDFLAERGLLAWQPPGQALQVVFTEPRSARLPVDDRAVRRARRRAEIRLADMLRYARSVTCRRQFLLAYFGETAPDRCGACDVCLGRHAPVVITPEDEPVMRRILGQVARDVPRVRWFDEDPPPEHRLDSLVDWLVQEGYLDPVDPLDERFRLTEKGQTFLDQWQPRTWKDGPA